MMFVQNLEVGDDIVVASDYGNVTIAVAINEYGVPVWSVDLPNEHETVIEVSFTDGGLTLSSGDVHLAVDGDEVYVR